VANATHREICFRRSTTVGNSPAPSPAAGAATTSPAIRRVGSASGPNRRWRTISRRDTPRDAAQLRGRWGEAVDLSLVHLTNEDIVAMVAYLRAVPPIANPDLPASRPPSAVAAHESSQGGNLLGECGSLRELSRIEGREPHLRPGVDRGDSLGQRSVRGQCRAGHPVRRRPKARRSRHGDAGRRRGLLSFRGKRHFEERSDEAIQ
jgi:hypothetical protein